MTDSRSMYNREQEMMTGKERLLRMYSLDEFGSFSPELISVYQATFLTTLIGATYGGLISMRNVTADMDPKAPKQSITFKPQTIAHRPSPDTIVSKFGKGAFFWGWRLGLFGGSCVLISSTISVYRGKSGIFEYIGTGGIIGSLSQANQGLRATAAGGLTGVVLGAFAGCAAFGISRFRGATVEENAFWRYGWKKSQLKQGKEIGQRLREEEERNIRAEKESAEKSEDKEAEAEFITDETERQAIVWR